MSIYFCFYVNTARDVVMIWLIFVNIDHFTYTFSHAHTEAYTHKTGSAHKRNGDNYAQEPGWMGQKKGFC